MFFQQKYFFYALFIIIILSFGFISCSMDDSDNDNNNEDEYDYEDVNNVDTNAGLILPPRDRANSYSIYNSKGDFYNISGVTEQVRANDTVFEFTFIDNSSRDIVVSQCSLDLEGYDFISMCCDEYGNIYANFRSHGGNPDTRIIKWNSSGGEPVELGSGFGNSTDFYKGKLSLCENKLILAGGGSAITLREIDTVDGSTVKYSKGSGIAYDSLSYNNEIYLIAQQYLAGPKIMIAKVTLDIDPFDVTPRMEFVWEGLFGSDESVPADYPGRVIQVNGYLYVTGLIYNNQAFLVKYDLQGNQEFLVTLGPPEDGISHSNTMGIDLAGDSEGNIYLLGQSRVDITAGGVTLENKGGLDIFLCKYNDTGELQWIKYIGTENNDIPNNLSIVHDINQNIDLIFISGTTQGMVNLDLIEIYETVQTEIYPLSITFLTNGSYLENIDPSIF